MNPALAIGLAAVVVAASAVLAMVETSFTRLGTVTTSALQRTHPERAERLAELLERPERVLAPALLLTLACHVIAATLVTIAAEQWFGAVGIVIAVVVEVLIVFLVAEAIPKSRAFAESLRVAGSIAPVASALAVIPIVAPLSRALMRIGSLRRGGAPVRPVVSEDDLLALAEAAAEAETIEAEERSLIESVFEFGDTIARSVMVPRPDMVVVHADATVAEALDLVVDRGRTRMPVYGEDIDDIIGLVLSKDLVRVHLSGGADEPVRQLLRPPTFVPETKRVAELMPEMQAAKSHLAIVVDEYGGTAGLVTLEDLIEELIGEIVDEFDSDEPLYEQVDADRLRVAARMPIDEFADLVEIDLPDDGWDTVGGFFYSQLGHAPEPGEAVETMGMRITAESIDGNRLEQLIVEHLTLDTADEIGGAS